MNDFEYLAPRKLDEATALMARHGGQAQLLAGGTDLLVFMRNQRKRPQFVIDAKKIPELTQWRIDGDQLIVGAAVSCRTLWESQEVAEKFPALADSACLIGGVQVQGRASLGGNLCNAAPSADTVPTLMVHSATVRVDNHQGTREAPVEAICVGPGQTSLGADEILVSFALPLPPARSGAAFLRFIPRNEMDIAVANAAAFVELDASRQRFSAARIAIGAVAPTPLLVEEAGAALAGQAVDDKAIATAAALARAAAKPINDMRGTVEHRKQLVETLTARALRKAIERARKRD